MKNRKIIFFIPSLGQGGGGRVISELSLNLPKHIQIIIVPFDKEISYPYVGKFIPLNICLSSNFFTKVRNFIVGCLRFRKIVREEEPDYVVSVGSMENIINLLVSKKAIVRVDTPIMKSHPAFSEKPYIFLVKILFNKAEKIITVAEGLEEELVKCFGVNRKKIKTIYNPLNITKIRNLAKEPLPIEYEKIFNFPVVACIGSLNFHKGQQHLIRAFRRTRETKKDLNLVLIGDGDFRPYLEKMVIDLNLNDAVHFLGWQENPFKFLSKSKIFVSASLWEGLPYALLEALTCQLPIVSTDSGEGGPREILAPDTDLSRKTSEIEYAEFGILIPVCNNKLHDSRESLTKNEETMRKAIVSLVGNEDLIQKYKENSLKRIQEFDIKKVITEWDSVFGG